MFYEVTWRNFLCLKYAERLMFEYQYKPVNSVFNSSVPPSGLPIPSFPTALE